MAISSGVNAVDVFYAWIGCARSVNIGVNMGLMGINCCIGFYNCRLIALGWIGKE